MARVIACAYPAVNQPDLSSQYGAILWLIQAVDAKVTIVELHF